MNKQIYETIRWKYNNTAHLCILLLLLTNIFCITRLWTFSVPAASASAIKSGSNLTNAVYLPNSCHYTTTLEANGTAYYYFSGEQSVRLKITSPKNHFHVSFLDATGKSISVPKTRHGKSLIYTFDFSGKKYQRIFLKVANLYPTDCSITLTLTREKKNLPAKNISPKRNSSPEKKEPSQNSNKTLAKEKKTPSVSKNKTEKSTSKPKPKTTKKPFLSIHPHCIIMKVNDIGNLSVFFQKNTISESRCQWMNSKPDVISQKGNQITALHEGTAVLYGIYRDNPSCKDTCFIRVIP